jgi:hypothetical protein
LFHTLKVIKFTAPTVKGVCQFQQFLHLCCPGDLNPQHIAATNLVSGNCCVKYRAAIGKYWLAILIFTAKTGYDFYPDNHCYNKKLSDNFHL